MHKMEETARAALEAVRKRQEESFNEFFVCEAGKPKFHQSGLGKRAG
jgi:transcription initiation factor IIE alpha subunit